MARDEPLTLQSLSPDVVEAARAAAAASGLTLDEWLNRTILGIVGGFAASRTGERRADSPDGRWADPLSSISQNLKSAADAASAAGVSFEQWLSEAILANTTAIARQGRTSEEPNLSLFRARPLPAAPRVVPFPDPRAERAPTPPAEPPALKPTPAETPAAGPKPFDTAALRPFPAETKATGPAPDDAPAIRPVSVETRPTEPSISGAPPAAAPTHGESAPGAPAQSDKPPAAAGVPIPDLPSFPDLTALAPAAHRTPKAPEIPDVVIAPHRPPAAPPPDYTPTFVSGGRDRTPVEPTFRAAAAEQPALRSDIPEIPPDSAEPVFDDPTIPDAVLDKRLAQIIADAREEVAAMARNAAPSPAAPRPLPITPETLGAAPPRPRRRGGSWLTVAALLVLAVVAAAVWVLPKLPQLGVQFEKKPDFVQQLPAPGSTARRDPASVDKIETLPLNRPGESERAIGEATGEVLPEPPSANVPAYRKAAETGNVNAQLALAQLYLRGDGVAKDLAEAARWYREAASKNNDANAQYALGVLLDRGIGVEKDPIEALLWFQRAAQQGHPAALTNTGVAYSRGEVVPRDYAKAFSYFQRAAEAGVAQAQFNLGLLYENGLGIQKDPVQAYRWYSAAASGGDPGAGQALERLMPTMTAEDLARAKDLVRQSAGKP
jgi:TPR repeat protein